MARLNIITDEFTSREANLELDHIHKEIDRLIFQGSGKTEFTRKTVFESQSIGVKDSFIATKQRAAITLTLPLARDFGDGKTLIIKDESGDAAASNITINTSASETIDGSASLTVSTNFGVTRLYSDLENWFLW